MDKSPIKINYALINDECVVFYFFCIYLCVPNLLNLEMFFVSPRSGDFEEESLLLQRLVISDKYHKTKIAQLIKNHTVRHGII